MVTNLVGVTFTMALTNCSLLSSLNDCRETVLKQRFYKVNMNDLLLAMFPLLYVTVNLVISQC